MTRSGWLLLVLQLALPGVVGAQDPMRIIGRQALAEGDSSTICVVVNHRGKLWLGDVAFRLWALPPKRLLRQPVPITNRHRNACSVLLRSLKLPVPDSVVHLDKVEFRPLPRPSRA